MLPHSSSSASLPAWRNLSAHARNDSTLAAQGAHPQMGFTPGQPNLGIDPRDAAPPATFLRDPARLPNGVQPGSGWFLSSEELSAYWREDNPARATSAIVAFTQAEEDAMKPKLEKIPASNCAMDWAHFRAGAVGWFLSFWVGAWADEAGRFADPSGALSGVLLAGVGGGLAYAAGGPIAGGLRQSEGSRGSPDDANMANLATVRAQTMRALFSCSWETFKNLDEVEKQHIKEMMARDTTFDASCLRQPFGKDHPLLNAGWRAWFTDDLSYFYWHVLLTVGAMTSPHLIDSHFGPELADRLYAAGCRLAYRILFGATASGLTTITQNRWRKWIQKTDQDPKTGLPSPPTKDSDHGLAAKVAALRSRQQILQKKLEKLGELPLAIKRRLADGQLTQEEARSRLDEIDRANKSLCHSILKVNRKVAKMHSTLGRNWMLIEQQAMVIYKGRSKTLPPHLKDVLNNGALKMRSLANFLGFIGAFGVYVRFFAKPIPKNPEDMTLDIAVWNAVCLMEMWKLRFPIARNIVEPFLGVGLGLMEGVAKGVYGAVNLVCGTRRNQHEENQRRMNEVEMHPPPPPEMDLEDPPVLSFDDPSDELPKLLMSAFQAFLDEGQQGGAVNVNNRFCIALENAQMLLELSGEEPNASAAFGKLLNWLGEQASTQSKWDGLQASIDILPSYQLQQIIENDPGDGRFPESIVALARTCLLGRLDRNHGTHEVKGHAPVMPDSQAADDEEEMIAAFLLEDAMTHNLRRAIRDDDPQALREGYRQARREIERLFKLMEPTADSQAVDETMRSLLELLWTKFAPEVDLVTKLLQQLPAEELEPVIGHSQVLRGPAQAGREWREISKHADRDVIADLVKNALWPPNSPPAVTQAVAAHRYSSAMLSVGTRLGLNESAVRGRMLDSVADLLATGQVTDAHVHALFQNLPALELDAMRDSPMSEPRPTRQQTHVRDIARECLARQTEGLFREIRERAEYFFGADTGQTPAKNYSDAMERASEQLNSVLDPLLNTPAAQRAWLMDALSVSLARGHVTRDQVLRIFFNLDPTELLAIINRRASVHARKDSADQITICARTAAAPYREELGEKFISACDQAIQAQRPELPAAANKAADRYEDYGTILAPGAFGLEIDDRMTPVRTKLVEKLAEAIGHPASGDQEASEIEQMRQASAKLVVIHLPQSD